MYDAYVIEIRSLVRLISNVGKYFICASSATSTTSLPPTYSKFNLRRRRTTKQQQLLRYSELQKLIFVPCIVVYLIILLIQFITPNVYKQFCFFKHKIRNIDYVILHVFSENRIDYRCFCKIQMALDANVWCSISK